MIVPQGGRFGTREFFDCANRVVRSARFSREASFTQHGTTTTLLHSVAVAYVATVCAIKMGYDGDLSEVCRAGLLHDYYLYDWHNVSGHDGLHGFTHPSVALRNASQDYADLTERERDAILHHMFPLVPMPPTHKVGWFVTLADKLCAAYEVAVREGVAYPHLRQLCAAYMPDVALDGPVPQRVGMSLPRMAVGKES